MVRIEGTTRLAGVIGWPLDHSLSPAVHNAAYEALGLDWAYVPLAVPDEIGFRRVLAAARSLPSLVGFNVTMPYKAAALEICDDVAMAARMAGAVNTIHCANGELVGYNTDSRGMLESLKDDAGFDAAGKNAVIIGAGGAAGGAFVGLVLAKCSSVTVVNRHPERGEELVSRMAPYLNATHAEALPTSGLEGAVRSADLVVNATPLGMAPDDPSPLDTTWLRQGQTVLDLVYGRPAPTALVAGARQAGAVAIDGLGMLICQAATAIDIWKEDSQVSAPRDVMRAAAEERLRERARKAGGVA